MTSVEAADYLKISLSTLYRHTSRKTIPHFKPGRKLLFEKRLLDEWLNSHLVKPKENHSGVQAQESEAN